jgi:NADPH2:quinone reductase
VIDAVGPNVDDARIGEAVWVYHAAWQRPTGTAAQSVVVPCRQAVYRRALGLSRPRPWASRS